MTTKTYTGLSSPTVEKTDYAYSVAHDATNSTVIVGSAIKNSKDSSSLYYVDREVMRFDSSSDPIPAGATITSAYITQTPLNIYADDGDWLATVISGSGCHNPVQGTDFGALLSNTLSYGSYSVSSMVYNTPFNINLSAGGIAEIVNNGITILGLRVSKDISNIAPSSYSKYNEVDFSGTGTLTVTYILASVTTLPATNISYTSATLNGNLVTGYTGNSVYFNWATDAYYTGHGSTYDNTTSTQTINQGNFSSGISGLTKNTLYHFQAVAVVNGTTYYGADLTFTPVLSIYNFIESSFEINTVLGQTISTMTGTIHDPARSVTIQEDSDVVINDINTGDKIFAGLASYVTGRTSGVERYWDLQCQSYSVLLDTSLVYAAYPAAYTNPDTSHTGDQGILEDLFAHRVRKADGSIGASEMTAVDYVQQGLVQNAALNFFNMTLRECVELLAGIVNFSYYVDYDKKLHYYYQPTETAPYGLSSSPDGTTTLGYRNLKWKRDGTRVRNAFLVLGSQLQGSDITRTEGGDGTTLFWCYPEYGPGVSLAAPAGYAHVRVFINDGSELYPHYTELTVGTYPNEASNWPPLITDPYQVAWAPLSNTFAYKSTNPPPAFSNAIQITFSIPINGGIPDSDAASITNYGRTFFTRLVASDSNSVAAIWQNLARLKQQFKSALEILTLSIDSTEFPSTDRFEIGQLVNLDNAVLEIDKSYWIHAIKTKVIGGTVVGYEIELRNWTLE